MVLESSNKYKYYTEYLLHKANILNSTIGKITDERERENGGLSECET